MSQRELAAGICSQSMISRLENNDFKISHGDLLHVLERLNMSLHDLIYQQDKNEAKQLRNELDEARSEGNYSKIEEIIYHKKTRSFWRSIMELEAYYQWHHGLLKYVREKNSKNALLCLNEAIRLSERNHLMSFSLPEIYMAKGNIYNEQNIIDVECYKEAERYYKKLGIKIPKLELKILYNMIRTNCKRDRCEEVIRDCDKAIRRLNKYESSYLICEIYYFKMFAYIKLGDIERYKKFEGWTYHLFKERNRLELLVNLENYSLQNKMK